MPRIARESLRPAVLHEARRIIAARGVRELTARDLAGAVGCSVGTLYNLYPTLDALVLTINAETLEALLEAVRKANQSADTPVERMKAMGLAYLRFAAAEPFLFQAVFDRPRAPSESLPGWFLETIGALRAEVESPLQPAGFPEAAREAAAAALWASVNGITMAALSGALAAVTRETAEDLVALAVERFLDG